jgi:hypothetical protein
MALNPDGTYNDKEHIDAHNQLTPPIPNLPVFCQAENDLLTWRFKIIIGAHQQGKVFTVLRIGTLSFSEVAPLQENGNQPDNPEEKNPYPVFIPDDMRTHRNVHADFIICAGRFIFRSGHD